MKEKVSDLEKEKATLEDENRELQRQISIAGVI
jgi:hypothetical protein